MTDLKKLARWHDRHGKAWPEQSAHAKKYAETAHILAALEAVREGCDFGPLRELNEGRPDVLCLDFTGPADTLRALDELLEGQP